MFPFIGTFLGKDRTCIETNYDYEFNEEAVACVALPVSKVMAISDSLRNIRAEKW